MPFFEDEGFKNRYGKVMLFRGMLLQGPSYLPHFNGELRKIYTVCIEKTTWVGMTFMVYFTT